jgi:hypothetical protein
LRQARYSSQPELRAVGSDRAKKTQKVEWNVGDDSN